MRNIICDVCGDTIEKDVDRDETCPVHIDTECPSELAEEGAKEGYSSVKAELEVTLLVNYFMGKELGKELDKTEAFDICRSCALNRLGVGVAQEKTKEQREE